MSSSDRIDALDGFRAVSIAMVVAAHFTPITAIPAGFGVTVFFVISGFIITHLLVREWRRTGGVDFVDFYKRRAFRILPPLVFCLVLLALLEPLLDREWINGYRALASLLFFQNYALIAEDYYFSPIGQHWSLAIEEQFYLVFPLVLLCLLRGSRNVLPWVLVLGVVVIVIRGLYVYAGQGLDPVVLSETIYRSTETRIDSIAAGVAMAFAYHRRDRVYRALCSPWCMAIGFGLLVSTKLVPSEAFQFLFRHTAQPLGAAMIMGPILFCRTGAPIVVWSRIVLTLPVIVYVGRVSFSLYLLHMIGFELAVDTVGVGPSLVPVAVLFALVLASFSFHVVEQPLIALGKRIRVTEKRAAA